MEDVVAMSSDEQRAILGEPSVTRDAFLGGRLELLQPVHGFRAGLDSVLLGAAVSPRSRSVADLGAGVGTAALVALTLGQGRSALLVERDAGLLALAQSNIGANGLAASARGVELDVAAPSAIRHAAGLAGGGFDAVIANPPFFATGTGTAPLPERHHARHMPADQLAGWAESAMTATRPGGEAIFILPAASLARILAPLVGRKGAITVLPLTPRPADQATRILVRWIKGSGAPLALLASRAIHLADRQVFAPEFDAIFRGRAHLHW